MRENMSIGNWRWGFGEGLLAFERLNVKGKVGVRAANETENLATGTIDSDEVDI